jgi:hypothetical protein
MNNKDPYLESKGVIAENIEEPNISKEILDNGYAKLGIGRDDLNKMGEIFNQVFIENGCTRNGLSYLKGVIFIIGSRKNGNSEWREHCSSSLRELFHEWKDKGKISNAFNNAFKSNSNNDKFKSRYDKFPGMRSEEAETYRKFELFYKFFSGICHHDPIGMTHAIRQLYNEEIKTNDISEELFLRAVNDFVKEIKGYFDRNIMEN